MNNPIVIDDACVLYPAPLRDLLMHLALTDLFQAKWTEDIHEEWIRNVLKNRKDLTYEQLQRTRQLMNENVRDCLVMDYHGLIEKFILPDPQDRHVLAAAIKSSASLIITYNLKDFPDTILSELGKKAIHPDNFIANLFDHAPGKICASIKRLRESLKNPPLTADIYLRNLRRQSLPKTVKRLSEFIALI